MRMSALFALQFNRSKRPAYGTAVDLPQVLPQAPSQHCGFCLNDSLLVNLHQSRIEAHKGCNVIKWQHTAGVAEAKIHCKWSRHRFTSSFLGGLEALRCAW
jgi:hypothetical protein